MTEPHVLHCPLISIAIPTYNRATILSKTLDALAAHPELLRDDIEICVSDNASTDDTAAVVNAFALRLGKTLVYHRNASNLGIDGNIHAVSRLATGRYLLLMSDDDFLRPGALTHLLGLLRTHPDLLFCFVNGGSFSGEYDATAALPPLIPLQQTLVTRDPNQVAETIWIWSTFISAFFVERAAWVAVRDQEQFIGTDIYLTHVLYRVLAMNRERTSIVTAEQLTAARMEYTGSFRIFYAFGESFMRLLCVDAPTMGFRRETMRAVKLATIRKGLPPMVLMVRRGKKPRWLSQAEWGMLFRYIWWEPKAWLYLVPFCLLPRVALDGLMWLRKRLLKRSLFA